MTKNRDVLKSICSLKWKCLEVFSCTMISDNHTITTERATWAGWECVCVCVCVCVCGGGGGGGGGVMARRQLSILFK